MKQNQKIPSMAFQNRAFVLNTMAQYTGGEDPSRSLKWGKYKVSVFRSFLNFEDPYILKSVKETNAMYFNQSGAYPVTRLPASDNRTT